MSKILKLTLTKKWFDLIEKGIKTEEYREIKSYWFNRLVFNHKKALNYYNVRDTHLDIDIKRVCEDAFLGKNIRFNDFDLVEFTNGYGKEMPQITLKVLSIKVSKGKVEWGAALNEFYFTINLGAEVSRKNF